MTINELEVMVAKAVRNQPGVKRATVVANISSLFNVNKNNVLTAIGRSYPIREEKQGRHITLHLLDECYRDDYHMWR